MNIETFIAHNVRKIEAGESVARRHCASVMVDGTTIYSYGYHYPLLFRVTGKDGALLWVCNNGGYSNTTAKHIGHARAHADVCAPIGANRSGFFSKTMGLEDAIEALEDAITRTESELSNKKRTDTQVYRALENQRAGLVHNLSLLK